jgi:hypothetical protein
MQNTLDEFITVESAVKILIDTYGQNAQSEASRRAHYAQLVEQGQNYQFWQEVLIKLGGIGRGPNKER